MITMIGGMQPLSVNEAISRPPGDVYLEVEGLVKATVARFVRCYGGRFDDLCADADAAFWRGWRACCQGKHNSENFLVEIRRWVWFELFDEYRVRAQHRRKDKVVIKHEEFIGDVARARPEFNALDFFDELSEDARVAAELVLDTPAELVAVVLAKGGEDRNMRSTIRAHLAGMGWGAARINEAFDEIRGALS